MGLNFFGTLGPSCANREILRKMFAEGMTGMRLNLSHTMLKDNKELLDKMFGAAEDEGITPSLLIDLRGPELRIGNLEGETELGEGSLISFGGDGIPLDERIIGCMESGEEISLDDGKIKAVVTEIREGSATAKVTRGGVLSGRKSIYLEGKKPKMPLLTPEDRENLACAAEFGVTGVMQPFVKKAEDIRTVRNELDRICGSRLRLYAKIESVDALPELEQICSECDEIVIARGDLGNSMPLWELPAVQKHISKVCREVGRDFMVVTQMLDSMRNSPIPTRAEVSDIYNAVLDGAASLMVTGETATGAYPALVISYLCRTALAIFRN